MSKSFREDLTGKRFGRLTVIEFVPNDKSKAFWRCKCDCGIEKLIDGNPLKKGDTLSCGCYHKEKATISATKHGKQNTKLYRVWANMKTRCLNHKNGDYKYYGERGITICDEWKNDFQKFYNWAIENGYDDTLTIDRIDVNGNYEPSNCRWITKAEQMRNQTKTVYVSYNGKMVCLSEAARIANINLSTLKDRYNRGDRGDRLFRSVKKNK